MKKILITAAALIVSLSAFCQETDAKAKGVIDKAAQKLQSGAFVADVQLTFTEQSGEKAVQKGEIKMSGNKFRLKISDMETIFDGKTQWVYAQKLNEVTISEPDKAELEQISPLLMMSGYSKKCRITFEPTENEDGFWHIALLPFDKKAEFFRIRIIINKKTNELNKMEFSARNGERFEISVGTLKTLAVTAETFVFQKNNYPKVAINDLR
ncbi:MAG: outer membrane lipoprotein carrier protein LolA [Prevotellaceae bacterium]|jgi:outer membrane lipoprotein-sorting protein|nr:outer membrane lipoprotein carrier protein LolA [Prevotellaceae bacterium]